MVEQEDSEGFDEVALHTLAVDDPVVLPVFSSARYNR